MIDVKSLNNDELTKLLFQPPHGEGNETPLSDKKQMDVLNELFIVRKATADFSNETLERILRSLLPPMPIGDERLRTIQMVIANELVVFDLDRADTDLWTFFEDEVLIEQLAINVLSSTPAAEFLARSAYIEIFLRGCANKVPDETLYSFIRRQISLINQDDFRVIVEGIIINLILIATTS